MLVVILATSFVLALWWIFWGTRSLIQASIHRVVGHYDSSWKIEVALWTTLSALTSTTLLAFALLLYFGFLQEVTVIQLMLYEVCAIVLLQILNQEFKRAISVGHKPFVNPWCDDIAEECHGPE